MDMDQIEKQFFSEYNIKCLFENIRETRPSISLRIVLSGMINAFEVELEFAKVPSMSQINSSACYYILCEFSRSIIDINDS